MPFLNKINSPEDLKQLQPKELPLLAKEVRDFILNVVSTKEGHLGASLGVVELSLALHYHYNTPHDLLLWDVGHQAYIHKLITERKEAFSTLRQWRGMSGFPDRSESKYDPFGTGHSSTSISAITGMAVADQMRSISRSRIAVVGDASIVSGMAIEGLNHLGSSALDVTIILNDNNMGIDYAVGALQKHFEQLDKPHSQSGFFEALGFHYHGVVDGHDFKALFKAFKTLDKINRPKLLHLRTLKGKGFAQAERDQVVWHAPGKFNIESGERETKLNSSKTYPNIVGKTLLKLFEQDSKSVAITPAMLTGSSLIDLQKKFPKRVINVGIAEQHAVTLAAGLASQGITPYCVVYSTFLQRAYDQIIHDVALQKLPVIFCIDRAGFVGNDGATHHGVFDISFLNSIPHLLLACPLDQYELQQLLQLGKTLRQPFAIRYPKSTISDLNLGSEKVKLFKAKVMKKGSSKIVLTTGTIGLTVYDAIKDSDIAWVHFPFVKPLDTYTLISIFKKFNQIHTFEEGVKNGGFGAAILDFASEQNYTGKINIHAYPDEFIPHGSMDDLNQFIEFDKSGIKKRLGLL